MTPMQSTFPTKESGIEWIGSIPEHWRVMPFYSFVDEVDHKNAGLKERNLLSLSYGRLVRKDMDRLEGLTPASFEGYNVIEQDDIVFRLTDLQNDQTSLRSARSPERGIITSAYVTVRPHSCPRFFEYLMRSYDTTKVFYGIGGGIRQSMKFSDLKRLPVVVPPESEMETIVAHLDRATTRIDTLVAKKTRFIELLREKRQALITHAVTKGLDAGAPMKDSGVEWLGKVPSTWMVAPLKWLVHFQRGHDLPADHRRSGDIPVISSGGAIGFHSTAAAQGPGIVTGRYGSIGQFTFVEEDYWPLNTALYSTDLRGNEPRFVWYLLHSLSDLFVMESNKSAIPGIDRNDIHEILVTHPQRSEQRAIVTYLDRATSRIDTLIAKTERSIELLREHRTALITAAVTGKIELREANYEERNLADIYDAFHGEVETTE